MGQRQSWPWVLFIHAITASAWAAAAARCPDATPVVVGDVSSLSGSLQFPESQRAAALAFEYANQHCLIKGHRILYRSLDDGGDPAKAAALTHDLVTNDGAVALVGGTSVVSCAINAGFYAATPVASIPGTGTGPRCFDSGNISPPNSGLFSITTLALKFAATRLSPVKLCLVGNSHPSIPGNFRDPVEVFEHLSGQRASIVNQELHPDDDPDAVVAQLLHAGCDVAFVGTLAEFGRRTSAALARSDNHSLKLILAPEAYTRGFAAQLDASLEDRVFVVTDMDFQDSKRPGMRAVREILDRGHVELSPFAVGGALAAQIIVDTTRKIDGPITRDSILKALTEMNPYDTRGLTASAYTFAWPASHRLPSGIHALVFRHHAWAHAADFVASLVG